MENDTATAAAAAAPATEQQPAPAARPERVRVPLPDHIQHALTLRAQQREVMAQMAQKNWGQNLDAFTLKAIADWCMRHGIDAAQEIDVLGNRIYLNAKFYLRGLAYLVDAGKVEYVDVDHVEDDARLEAYPAEKKRRLELRIQYGLPDNAKSAVIARVKLRNVPVEFSGAQWAGGRGTNTNNKLKDPIGEERPIETAETRALRRCLRLMVTHIPEQARRRDEAMDEALDLENIIREGKARVRQEATEGIDNRGAAPMAEISDGAYGDRAKPLPLLEGRPQVREVAATAVREPVLARMAHLASEDPYRIDAPTTAAPPATEAVRATDADDDFQDDRHLDDSPRGA